MKVFHRKHNRLNLSAAYHPTDERCELPASQFFR
jgi:hypothetical protein